MAFDPAWRARLHARLDAPPATARAALVLAVRGAAPVTIGSIEPGLARALAAASLPLRSVGEGDGADEHAIQSAHWQIDLPHEAAITPTLARIADTLRALGRTSAWRHELLDVGGDGSAPIGAIERAAVRPLGIATRAVHLVVHDPRGHVWVQQRAFDKSTDPGLWDTTMGGLSSAGETSAQTLERETWEEAGLRLAELRDVAVFGHATVRRPVANGYLVEHIEMVAARLDDGATPVNQDGEVASFECLDPAALTARMHAEAFTLDAAMILVHWLGQRAAHGPLQR